MDALCTSSVLRKAPYACTQPNYLGHNLRYLSTRIRTHFVPDTLFPWAWHTPCPFRASGTKPCLRSPKATKAMVEHWLNTMRQKTKPFYLLPWRLLKLKWKRKCATHECIPLKVVVQANFIRGYLINCFRVHYRLSKLISSHASKSHAKLIKDKNIHISGAENLFVTDGASNPEKYVTERRDLGKVEAIFSVINVLKISRNSFNNFLTTWQFDLFSLIATTGWD